MLVYSGALFLLPVPLSAKSPRSNSAFFSNRTFLARSPEATCRGSKTTHRCTLVILSRCLNATEWMEHLSPSFNCHFSVQSEQGSKSSPIISAAVWYQAPRIRIFFVTNPSLQGCNSGHLNITILRKPQRFKRNWNLLILWKLNRVIGLTIPKGLRYYSPMWNLSTAVFSAIYLGEGLLSSSGELLCRCESLDTDICGVEPLFKQLV